MCLSDGILDVIKDVNANGVNDERENENTAEVYTSTVVNQEAVLSMVRHFLTSVQHTLNIYAVSGLKYSQGNSKATGTVTCFECFFFFFSVLESFASGLGFSNAGGNLWSTVNLQASRKASEKLCGLPLEAES